MDGGAPKDQSLHEETNKQELESTKGGWWWWVELKRDEIPE